MAGQMEPARSVLEAFFARNPHMRGVDDTRIYEEARALYNRIAEALQIKKMGH